MLKHEELSDPDSCFNRARDDEMVFVLLERDDAFAATIRFWVAERIRIGKNRPGDLQLLEAIARATEVETKKSQEQT